MEDDKFIEVTKSLIEEIKKDAPRPDRDPRSVLIVEDNPNDREMMLRRLERFGFTVKSVITGEEALSACENHNFAAVFLDLNLGGGINGLTVLEKLRKKPVPPRVVIVTGAADASFGPELARIGGYFELIQKPIQRTDMELLFPKRLTP